MRAQSAVGRRSLLSSYSTDLGALISRRRGQDALKAANAESNMANRAKSEFLAQMSHELRTPLNAIIGFSELIKSSRAGGVEKSREYAELIETAGKHLLQIINDILDISKIEAGTFKLTLAPHSISDIIDASVAMVRPRLEGKNQTLHLRAGQNLPPVLVDALRIKQVLINLVSNASKFTANEGKIVVVAMLHDRTMTVAVSDTGAGMTQEEIALAMKPFVQVQSNFHARTQEGTGLGLPIAKALVLQHGGRFHVTSAPGVGTTVAFTLPHLAGG
jgi:two-component system cell cycle sensor histidine kinase PleC